MLITTRSLLMPAAALFVALFAVSTSAPVVSADVAAGVGSVASAGVKYSLPVMNFGAGDVNVLTGVVFHPTALVANSRGEAQVRLDHGVMKIHAVFSGLPPAFQIGRGDLTYVLWSVSAQGQATNHGEVTMTGSQAEIDAKVGWRRFGLLVTAEPYFAVSRPSTHVVFVAGLAPGSQAEMPVTQTACTLISGAARAAAADPSATDGPNPPEPLIFAEARRAIAAARAAGAEQYAPLTFGTSNQLLQLAKKQLARGSKMQDVLDTGSEAVLIAEDARVLATARRKRAHQADPPSP
jgi:hypothetical protein